jgi:phosphoribosylaminoimidazole-succinocarboxamide synthase
VQEQLIYEGKAKKLFKTEEEQELRVVYLDQATALNGLKKDAVAGKGELNNQITSLIFQELTKKGISSHFIKKLSKHEQLVRAVDMLPLEIVVRNTAAGSFSKRLGISEGEPLPFPIVEFYYKEDHLDDPFINEDHIQFLKIASTDEVEEIKQLARKVNLALRQIFEKVGIDLIDFKIEVGKDEGTILLADEISPDTCRLWDLTTKEHLDKDVYRREIGELVPVYQEVLNRLEKEY